MQVIHLSNNQEFISKMMKATVNYDFNYTNITDTDEILKTIVHDEASALILDESFDFNLDKIPEILNDCGIHEVSIMIATTEENFDLKEAAFTKGITNLININTFDERKYIEHLFTIKMEFEIKQLLKSVRIAVIDDSRLILAFIKEIFLQEGITNVKYFSSSECFIQDETTYDIYVCDYVLPNMNGDKLIEVIRKKNKNSLILIMTSFIEGNIIPHSLNLGADDFIQKPFDGRIFMLRLNACLRQNKLKNENLIAIKKLYSMATIDSLTGLFNRNYLNETFHSNSKMSQHLGRNSSLILIDIDHFKKVNDFYGHQKGDEVLVEFSILIKSLLRENDLVCRWGGEEFLILLNNSNITTAELVAEKLRDAIEKNEFKSIPKLTASFGVTDWDTVENFDLAFKRLDNSLYISKFTGRNKITVNEMIHLAPNSAPLFIEWGHYFKSGKPEIDNQHQTIIDLTNNIIKYNALNQHFVLEVTIEHFFEVLCEHFSYEESEMIKDNYANFEMHKSEHFAIMNILNEFHIQKLKLIKDDLIKYIVQEIIINHFIKYDSQYFEFAKENVKFEPHLL